MLKPWKELFLPGLFCTTFNYVLDGIISFELTIQQNPLDRAEIAP